jgi:polar amino acid transport system substrate-binding protein
VLTNKGTKVDEVSIKGMRIGVQQATTGASFVDQKLKPKIPASVYPDTPSMFTALQAGQIDVAMTDTSIVLAQAGASNGVFEVVGQYATGETYGALYPKGGANNATIDKIIQALIDDGTLKMLSAKYLTPAWGADPLAVLYFNAGT